MCLETGGEAVGSLLVGFVDGGAALVAPGPRDGSYSSYAGNDATSEHPWMCQQLPGNWKECVSGGTFRGTRGTKLGVVIVSLYERMAQ